jgi:hypothetical protein
MSSTFFWAVLTQSISILFNFADSRYQHSFEPCSLSLSAFCSTSLIHVINILLSRVHSGYQHSVQLCWFTLLAFFWAVLIQAIRIILSRVDSSYQHSVQPCWFKFSELCSPSLSWFLLNNITLAAHNHDLLLVWNVRFSRVLILSFCLLGCGTG